MATTVTVFNTFDPCPRVTIQFDSALLNVVTYSVQASNSRATYFVRGAEKAPWTGSFFVTDYEVAGGIPTAYKITLQDSTNGWIYNQTAATVTPAWDVKKIVFTDPLFPARTLVVRGEQGFAENLKRKRSVNVVTAGTRTISLSSLMGKLEDIPMPVFTSTKAEATAMETLLTSTSVVVVRAMPPVPLPGQVFGVIPAAAWSVYNAAEGGEGVLWSLTLTEISRPTTRVLFAVVNYLRFHDGTATYATRKSFYSTYLAAKLNPPVI